ncbi:unnamed protein product [Oikopleura dioica]|uniref:PDZ domain-containing protein n=1 Tax=Oikopleura dioica TaxID=34765 RepID=E4WT07_OIKDI|nr:unnamed protein product [Oikopleura dioica]
MSAPHPKTEKTYSVNVRIGENHGITIKKDDNSLAKVSNVSLSKNTNAWLKLKREDKVLRIDDKPVWNMTEEQINTLLTSKLGKVNMVVRRGSI